MTIIAKQRAIANETELNPSINPTETAMPIVHEEVVTPGDQKGLIMRTLMEQLAEQGADLVLVDGIKVQADDGWALVVPDPEDPVTHVWAEGIDLPGSVALATAYVERITALADN